MEYRKFRLVAPVMLASLLCGPAEDVLHTYAGNNSYATAEAYAGQRKKPKKPADNLKGSRHALLEQNRVADKHDLTRIENDAMLGRMIRGGYLVHLDHDKAYVVDNRMPDRYEYVRPYTRLFLRRLSEQYQKTFGERLRVTSAVRTAEYQNKLRRGGNGNAAPSSGPTASSHMTGATVDITKIGMNSRQLNWMRRVLARLDSLGYIEATEEQRQQVFHVMIYPGYSFYVKNITNGKM